MRRIVLVLNTLLFISVLVIGGELMTLSLIVLKG